ncbi:MAG: transcriptional repressor [Dehalococcoidia bacterium]|nr:transcriptional repressor [Dehalococcoidia bacterium]
MVTSEPHTLQEGIEQAGHRLTYPRQAILDLVAQHPDGFTAEEVCAQLPQVGRATVYRTVKLLLDLGLVCKMTGPDGAPRYTLSVAGHHHHTLCVRCGAAADFQRCTVDLILQTLRAETAGVILGHRMEVYVLCPRCLEQEETTSSGSPT